jgi:hypothetical protein
VGNGPSLRGLEAQPCRVSAAASEDYTLPICDFCIAFWPRGALGYFNMGHMICPRKQDSDEGFALWTLNRSHFDVDLPTAVRPIIPHHNIVAKDLLTGALYERKGFSRKVSKRSWFLGW